MATRENQGLFIAVILLVLLSVVLAVATFFGFSGLREAQDQRDSLKENLDTAKKQAVGYQAQAEILKVMVGFSGAVNEIPTYEGQLQQSGMTDLASEMQNIKVDYEADMRKMAAGEDGTDLTYRNLAVNLTSGMAAAHNTATVQNNLINETELKLETELAAKDKVLAEKDNSLNKAREALATEQQSHGLTRTELTDRLEEVETRYKTEETLNQELSTKLANAENSYKNDISARDAKIIAKETIIEGLTATETDVKDGDIISVAPSLGKVTIDLGADDSLRLKQTFAVYDKHETTYKSGRGKAMLEVTKILGPHQAECRITRQILVNPILMGDVIVTSTWDPGYSVPVAIAGRINLDGDDDTDLQRLISIVELTGYGKVVASHDDQGNVTGEIDENTRFFVKGEDPIGKAVDGYNRLDTQRERYQTRTISVQEFLNEMGWQSEAKIQHFNEKNVPSNENFKERQPGTQVESGDPFDG